ncbi:MAG: hypothetical protein ACYSUY_19610, partial [Planctomycetota bacterium]
WWNTPVRSSVPSDPFLMTGFDKKVVHMAHDEKKSVTFLMEVDFLGNGSWRTYKSFNVAGNIRTQRAVLGLPAEGQGYVHHEFPDGFSAHWVRVIVDTHCKATVYFMYN